MRLASDIRGRGASGLALEGGGGTKSFGNLVPTEERKVGR